MREDKKKARSKQKLAELFGMEPPENPTGPSALRMQEDNSREAEAVLDYLGRPNKYLTKTCRRCGKDFMVNRANVALCSDFCREKELADVGIGWRWDRSPSERWYYVFDGDKRNTEPLVIGPEATEVLVDNAVASKVTLIDGDIPSSAITGDISSVGTTSDIDDDFLFGNFDSEQSA